MNPTVYRNKSKGLRILKMVEITRRVTEEDRERAQRLLRKVEKRLSQMECRSVKVDGVSCSRADLEGIADVWVPAILEDRLEEFSRPFENEGKVLKANGLNFWN